MTWKLGLVLVVVGCGGPPSAPETTAGQTAAAQSPVERTPANAGATAVTKPEPEPVGELRLEGQVIDASQSPVGGARVTISTVPPRDVFSSEDGSFAFDHLVARTYRVSAVAGAHAAGAVNVSLTATSDPLILHIPTMGAPKRRIGYGEACNRNSQCPSDGGCHDGICVQYPE